MTTPFALQKKAVVLSNQTQLSKFVEGRVDWKKYVIFCDNAEFYITLETQGINYIPLDEFQLANEWESINRWGCSQGIQWVRLCRQMGFFEVIDLPSAMNHYFSRMLVQVLKNFIFAQRIHEQCALESVVVFESATRKNFPDFSGNFYLNHFLEVIARAKHISVCKLLLTKKNKSREYMTNYFSFKEKYLRALRSQLRHLVNRSYGKLRPAHLEIDVLAYGPLTHLKSTILELKRQQLKIALYDYEYHFGQHRFARKSKIPYLIPHCFSTKRVIDFKWWAASQYQKVLEAFDELITQGLFCEDRFDFAPFVRKHIFLTMHGYLVDLAKKCNHYEHVVKVCSPKTILVHDDFSLQGGFLAAFARQKGIEVVCISHANLAVDFSVSQEDQFFAQATTVVNSEHEKSMYAARGWNPSKIVVTGTPRYDRLKALSRTKEREVRAGTRKRVLYCAGGLWHHSPDHRGYLGMGGIDRHNQLPIFCHVLKAISDLPIELIVKPRFDTAVPLWRHLIHQEKRSDQVIVTSHATDIFQLYETCDAIIVPYWSTALLEAAIIGLPIIYVHMDSGPRPSLYAFSKAGHCRVVCNINQLTSELKKVCQGDPASVSNLNNDWFLGKRDGHNTERVVQLVLGKIKSQSASRSTGYNLIVLEKSPA